MAKRLAKIRNNTYHKLFINQNKIYVCRHFPTRIVGETFITSVQRFCLLSLISIVERSSSYWISSVVDFKDGGSLKARFLVEGKKSNKFCWWMSFCYEVQKSKSIFISFMNINLGDHFLLKLYFPTSCPIFEILWVMLILGQKSCFLGPTIFKIPQPRWYYETLLW